MDDFNLCFFVDTIKESFNLKKSRLVLALRAVGWKSCITCLNDGDTHINKIVNDIMLDTAKRRELENQSYHILYEEADTIQESIDEWIFLAAVYWCLGIHLVASDWRDGVTLLLKSTELLDMCHGIVHHEIWQNTEAKKKEQATNGGKAKASLYAPLKAEIIRLLYCNKPADGWRNRREAIELIDEDVSIFIQEHGYPGSPEEKQEDLAVLFSRIPRLIEDWSRNGAVVKAAFNATLKKKSANKGAEQKPWTSDI
ncbi:hypothetical protein [Klebsiella pneumoniae]|uniref:hypothetical protein n=1 Tax=Klebsiella pneumoniae TaxID=573 RepID=UPI000B96A547|nr:hypothetical protein [Klebsiella pneumoniae]MCS6703892.1 hypothetical protein [Klebsiella pneumoniae subsp. pneumoniae]QDJ76073.1 hypothetical protein CI667_0005935 [Klebsiella pneumoniae subsp. pneumoniae]HBR0903138.1 hypothetical protein [Klebsiella pneumoniae]HBR0909567.1 hypothetical protein [Klebsiella pneumoniae]HBR1658667.1 hypothetical protein [Klebsiella pneumoniae]